MKQVIITLSIIVVSISLLMIIVLGSKSKKNETIVTNGQTKTDKVDVSKNQPPVFFYGNTCPHCAEVEKWLDENKITEKIKIIKKEVYDNKENASELTNAAKSCNLPTDSIGVPFLYAEGKCFIGTPDVINYLSKKSGITNTSGSTEGNNL